jgi:hypothetical protein
VLFTDIDGYFAEDAIVELTNDGIIDGYEDGTFRPQGDITRAEFVKLTGVMANVNKSAETNDFDDVQPDDWFNSYVSWAAQKGIIHGYGDGTFQPDRNITMEEIAVVVNNYVDYMDVAGEEAPAGYENNLDEELVSDWAQGAVNRLIYAGILRLDEQGYLFAGVINSNKEGYLYPKDNATRGIVTQILYNIKHLPAVQSRTVRFMNNNGFSYTIPAEWYGRGYKVVELGNSLKFINSANANAFASEFGMGNLGSIIWYTSEEFKEIFGDIDPENVNEVSLNPTKFLGERDDMIYIFSYVSDVQYDSSDVYLTSGYENMQNSLDKLIYSFQFFSLTTQLAE